MFDPLSSAFLCQSLSEVLRTAAAGSTEGADDEFARAQLLAASSIARLVALEIEHGPAVERRFARQLRGALDAADEELDRDSANAVAELAVALRAGWGAEAERALGDLLDALARSDAGAAATLLVRLRALTREAIDREVDMFAHGTPPR